MEDRTIPRGVAVVGLGPAEVHFDGACERTGRGSIAGFGFTVSAPGLDHEGYGLAVPPFHPRATNNVAEYAGAICALEWLARQGFAGDVTVRGDSQLVIRQMTGEYRIRAEHLKAYHDRLRQLSERFRRVDFVWVPRDQNLRADQLSKQAVAEASYPSRKRPAPKVGSEGLESETYENGR